MLKIKTFFSKANFFAFVIFNLFICNCVISVSASLLTQDKSLGGGSNSDIEIPASVIDLGNDDSNEGIPKQSSDDANKESDNENQLKLIYSDEFISDEYDQEPQIDVNLQRNMEDQQDHENQQGDDWDVLIFTQQWPVTTCYHWREKDKSHACTLPTKKEFWTIHGIWPTKLGHIGPSFCNKSADFDPNQLEAIRGRLQIFWPDIDGESKEEWLWKHEWLKHGTCASLLNNLNNELKYFNQGLEWRNDYLISDILDDANIHPDSNNTVITLQAALVKGLGKNPSIHCLYDNKNDVSYLSEIRICFNKSLALVDCDGVKLGDTVHIDYPGGTVITNCPISKPVHYPSLVPSKQYANTKKSSFTIVNLFKLVQFLQWFTL